jgi:hypothetical protein
MHAGRGAAAKVGGEERGGVGNGVSLLKGVSWYWAFQSAWSVVGNRWRAQRLQVIIVSSLRHCYYFFSFLGFFVPLSQHFLCFKLLYRCG